MLIELVNLVFDDVHIDMRQPPEHFTAHADCGMRNNA